FPTRRSSDLVGSLVEADGDFGPAPLQILSGPQVEGHPGPAPVVDLQLPGDVGLGVRIGRNVGFSTISLGLLAHDGAGIVLAAYGVLRCTPGRDRPYGLDDFRLLVPN